MKLTDFPLGRIAPRAIRSLGEVLRARIVLQYDGIALANKPNIGMLPSSPPRSRLFH
jgi:hypothetical protein